jgi:hypothetical protein
MTSQIDILKSVAGFPLTHNYRERTQRDTISSRDFVYRREKQKTREFSFWVNPDYSPNDDFSLFGE